jgi:hypothetical protein
VAAAPRSGADVAERHQQHRGFGRAARGDGRDTTFAVPEHGMVMLAGIFFGTKKPAV